MTQAVTVTATDTKTSNLKKYAFAEANVKLREWCDTYKGRTLLLSASVFGTSIGHNKSGRRRITDANKEIMLEAMAQIEREERAGLISKVNRGGTVRVELEKTNADYKQSPEYYQKIRDSAEYHAFSDFFANNKQYTNTLLNDFGILFLKERPSPSPLHFNYVNKERVRCANRWINEYNADADAINICAKRIKAFAGDRTRLLSGVAVKVRENSKLSADRDVSTLLQQLESSDELFAVTADVYAVNYVEDSLDSFEDFYKLLECKSKSYLTAILRSCISRANMVIHNDAELFMGVSK